jgi:hypothetical protein
MIKRLWCYLRQSSLPMDLRQRPGRVAVQQQAAKQVLKLWVHIKMISDDRDTMVFESDGGVESGHATASGSGPLPEPIAIGDACSALEPPHRATNTVGRHQELKRAVGVTPDPSDTSASVLQDGESPHE